MSLEPNVGQTDNRVKFLARSPGFNLFITKNEAVFVLGAEVLRLQLLGASDRPEVGLAGRGQLRFLVSLAS